MKPMSYEVAKSIASLLQQTVAQCTKDLTDEHAMRYCVPDAANRERLVRQAKILVPHDDLQRLCMLIAYRMCFDLLVALDQGMLRSGERVFGIAVTTSDGLQLIDPATSEYLGDAIIEQGGVPPMSEI